MSWEEESGVMSRAREREMRQGVRGKTVRDGEGWGRAEHDSRDATNRAASCGGEEEM